jgi:hypothetical protein
MFAALAHGGSVERSRTENSSGVTRRAEGNTGEVNDTFLPFRTFPLNGASVVTTFHRWAFLGGVTSSDARTGQEGRRRQWITC